MVNLKNQPVYYITIKANRDSEIKTLYAGEDYLGLAGFFIDFDKARCFSCPVSAEKWFKFHFDEETLPPEYYDWTSITIEELKLVPVMNIYLSKEDTVSNSATLETTTKREKPKRTYKKKKAEDKIDTIPDT